MDALGMGDLLSKLGDCSRTPSLAPGVPATLHWVPQLALCFQYFPGELAMWLPHGVCMTPMLRLHRTAAEQTVWLSKRPW